MTNQEIIERLRTMKAAWMATADAAPESRGTAEWAAEAINGAISSLKGPTREQAEKMRGEWIIEDAGDGDRRKKCSLCDQPISGWWGRDRFCANCGSPMTDEAVETIMKRMEEMRND